MNNQSDLRNLNLGIVDDHTVFIYDRIKVFFKHTDYYGKVHVYNYLEWMSYAREAFFNKIFPSFSDKAFIKFE